MFLTRPKLVISLFPNQLAAGVFHSGKLQREESICLNASDWQPAWKSGLTPFDPALRQVLSRLRLPAKTPISVLYHSPSAIVRVEEYAGSKAEAQSAALLRFQQSDDAGILCSAHAAARSANKPDHWTVIAVSERDDTANTIYAWVTRCGGTLATIQPAQAAVLEDAVASISDADDRQATCVIGQEWSAVVAGDKEGVELARIFELGFRSLADVFARAYKPGEVLSGQEAEAALMSIGVPVKRGTIPDELRRDLLPQIAPIVQRISVEIKQTLRFGLAGNDAPKVLAIRGPGASIPEIENVLSEGTDMHVRAGRSDSNTAGQHAVFSSDSSEFAFGSDAVNRLAMTPRPAIAEQGAGLFKKASLAGACCAALVIAGEYAWVKQQQSDLQPGFDAISADVAAIVSEREHIEEASALAYRTAISGLAVEQSTPVQPDIAKALTMISDAVNDNAMFNGIEFRLSSDEASVFLSGHAEGDTEDAAGQTLAEMVTFLESHALISRIEMGAVTNDTNEDTGGAIRQFSMTAFLEPERRFYQQLARFADAHEVEHD